MRLENAIDFLLYSYFNLRLEKDDEKDKVVMACIERAYLDATQRRAFNMLIPKGNDKMKKAAKDEGTEAIKNAICKLAENSIDISGFDKWHSNICKELHEGVYSKFSKLDKNTFTYGNAQKWVNMTLKYLSVLNEIYKEHKSPKCEYCKEYKNIKKYEKYFHVPVDSYIMRVVYDKREGECKAVELPKRKEEEGKKYSGFDKYAPWSTWEEGDYKKFQRTLRDSGVLGDSPLDWENREWIDVAIGRRKK